MGIFNSSLKYTTSNATSSGILAFDIANKSSTVLIINYQHSIECISANNSLDHKDPIYGNLMSFVLQCVKTCFNFINQVIVSI